MLVACSCDDKLELSFSKEYEYEEVCNQCCLLYEMELWIDGCYAVWSSYSCGYQAKHSWNSNTWEVHRWKWYSRYQLLKGRLDRARIVNPWLQGLKLWWCRFLQIGLLLRYRAPRGSFCTWVSRNILDDCQHLHLRHYQHELIFQLSRVTIRW